MNALLESIQVPMEQGRPIVDAATRELIGYAPIQTVEDLNDSIAEARRAQPAWAALGHSERRQILHAIANDLDLNAAELGDIVAREQGKPRAEKEVRGAAHFLRAAADTELTSAVIFDNGTTRSELHYVPLGVVGSIGPWNFPVMISVWHFAPALRMGNTVVVKPSSYTPLSVLALVEIANRHLPAGVLTAVSGDRNVGNALAAHSGVDKVIFTGSTETGRKIVESSANNLARLTLELGGNDAAIVLPDVNAKAVAERLFWAAFGNSGQICAALKRLYVHSSIYESVVQELAELANQISLGPGSDPATGLGPVQNQRQFEIVVDLVEDAREQGARIVAGGKPAPELGPLFYRPTIVADISDGSRLVDEEQFGPVLPVIRYEEIDEAVLRANATDQGLGASVWGDDTEQTLNVAHRLEAGTVWVNQHGGLNPLVPFGGTKSSGYGLEFGAEGLKAMAATKVITQ